MLHKQFYSHKDFQERLGVDADAVQQAIARGELAAWVRLNNCAARLRFLSGTGGVGPDSGRNEFSSWIEATKPYKEASDFYYLLNGWFRVEPNSMRDAALAGTWGATPVRVVLPPENDGLLCDGDIWELSMVVPTRSGDDPETEVEWTLSPSFNDFWFSAQALAEYQARGLGDGGSSAPPDKALSTRERNNLLRVIAGLAKEARIDLSEGAGGAIQIEAAVSLAGFDGPKERTIREILKDVRNLG